MKLLNFGDLNDVENFGHLIPYSAGDKVQAINWIVRLGHKIKCKCIIIIFSEDGLQFHFVKILSYKIFDDQCYSYAVPNLRGIPYNTPISITNKLPVGYYIAKHWM